MKKLLALCALITLSSIVSAQNTLELAEGQPSPPAKINDVAWIAGHWQGEAFGGVVEERWAPPMGGAMMGSFRLVNDGKVSFYELEVIYEKDNSLMLSLKHFHADVKGWEEKDVTVDFPLVKIEDNRAYFEGFTIELEDKDHLNMYVVISDGEKKSEVKFPYIRVN